MNVATHQEKEKNEKTVKGKAGEDRPILKRLRATLLRSFRGLHGEKMVCSCNGRRFVVAISENNFIPWIEFKTLVGLWCPSFRLLGTPQAARILLSLGINAKRKRANQPEVKHLQLNHYNSRAPINMSMLR